MSRSHDTAIEWINREHVKVDRVIHLSDRKRETKAMFRSRGVNIWYHEMPIRFGGIPLWYRMTVIRLRNGGLVVHSPTSLDIASQEEFQKLGPIVAIIAPSWWHDLYLREQNPFLPRASIR
jgi:hypothetical protein